MTCQINNRVRVASHLSPCQHTSHHAPFKRAHLHLLRATQPSPPRRQKQLPAAAKLNWMATVEPKKCKRQPAPSTLVAQVAARASSALFHSHHPTQLRSWRQTSEKTLQIKESVRSTWHGVFGKARMCDRQQCTWTVVNRGENERSTKSPHYTLRQNFLKVK